MSQVYEPVRVGATGGSGCGCRLGICNPSPTHSRDTGSQVLPVSVIESHAVVYNHIKRQNENSKHMMEHVGGIATTRGQEYMVRPHSLLFFSSTDYYNSTMTRGNLPCHSPQYRPPPMDPASQINAALTQSV